MKAVLTAPPSELADFNSRKNSLLRRRSDDIGARASVRQLLREMKVFRSRHPDFESQIIDWEVELLDGFPGVEHENALTV